jgi:hypothetical protein
MRTAAVLGAFVVLGLGGQVEARPTVPYKEVVLQGLDKVTARVRPFEVAVGEPMLFGTLEVTLRACLEAPPIDPPESAAFLEIRDVETSGEKALVFQGWMFGSSPGLSALEHPVYDVWVLQCEEPVEPPAEG